MRCWTGDTPADYLASWRIGLAQGLLRAERPLEHVATEVGYGRPSALTRAFVRRVALTTEMVKTQGRPSPAVLDTFFSAGFAERDVLYIVLAIAVKTLSNYSNHAFATAVDDVIAGYKVA
jgi:AraC-like DNA-binding protein